MATGRPVNDGTQREKDVTMQQTTFLLRSLWATPPWRDDLLATFERWVQDGTSRSEVKSKVQTMIKAHLPEQVGGSSKVDLEQVNWDQVLEFFCTCFYSKRLRRPLPDVPPDDLWMKLTDEHSQGPLSPHPQQDRAIKETVPAPLVPLEQKLLAQGGTRLVYRLEPDLEPLLRRGEVFDELVELVPGELHTCHANAARLWQENREALALVTGYALSEDGLWRQHSWVMRKQPTAEQCRLIETTVKRVKYFGFLLNEVEAEAFLRMNG